AEADPKDERTLATLPGYGGRSVRRLARTWLNALDAARELPSAELPGAPPSEGPPPPHRWAERDPVAADRLARCPEQVTGLAAQSRLRPENLIARAALRRLAGEPPPAGEVAEVRAALQRYGARQWQIDLTAEPLTAALPTPD